MQIPTASAAEGARLAWRNAESMLESAASESRRGQFGVAVALCVLSFEESAKAAAMAYASTGADDPEFIKSVFKYHEPKQDFGGEAAALLYKALKDSGNAICGEKVGLTTSEMESILQSWPKKANSLKQRGLYVGFQQGQWQAPNQLRKVCINRPLGKPRLPTMAGRWENHGHEAS